MLAYLPPPLTDYSVLISVLPRDPAKAPSGAFIATCAHLRLDLHVSYLPTVSRIILKLILFLRSDERVLSRKPSMCTGPRYPSIAHGGLSSAAADDHMPYPAGAFSPLVIPAPYFSCPRSRRPQAISRRLILFSMHHACNYTARARRV